MIKNVIEAIRSFFTRTKYWQLRMVFWFIAITLVIHFSYRFWAQDLIFYPIKSWMEFSQDFLARMVFDQSTWMNRHILGIDLVREGQIMKFQNGASLIISRDCSGDKQIFQLALLLLVLPGKWMYKLWFIPMGVILVHALNVLRIVLLSLVAVWKPEWVELAHDTVLRGMFYLLIFGIWMWFIHVVKNKTTQNSDSL